VEVKIVVRDEGLLGNALPPALESDCAIFVLPEVRQLKEIDRDGW